MSTPDHHQIAKRLVGIAGTAGVYAGQLRRLWHYFDRLANQNYWSATGQRVSHSGQERRITATVQPEAGKLMKDLPDLDETIRAHITTAKEEIVGIHHLLTKAITEDPRDWETRLNLTLDSLYATIGTMTLTLPKCDGFSYNIKNLKENLHADEVKINAEVRNIMSMAQALNCVPLPDAAPHASDNDADEQQGGGAVEPLELSNKKLSPCHLKAKVVYDWAIKEKPGAAEMTVAELFDAIECHTGSDVPDGLPPTAETFAKYLRIAGGKQKWSRLSQEPSQSIRRSSEV